MTGPCSVTVVVCAYTEERFDDLRTGVAEAARQLAAADVTGEMMVVVDHSPPLLSRSRAEIGTIATVLANQHRRGLSGARNTAIDHAAGEVIVFLDDDACPRSGWLERLLAPYEDPAVLGVGGRAVPRWPESGRPGHLPTRHPEEPGEFDWVVGCSYAGQPEVLSPIRNLMGCSMSLRTVVLKELGGFAEDLGRIGTIPLGCEETELCLRAAAAHPDGRFLHEPASLADHRVTAVRVRWSYLWSRCHAEGISKAAVSGRVRAAAALASERAYVIRILPAAVLRELGRVPKRRSVALAGVLGLVGGLVMTGIGYLRGRLALARLASRSGGGRVSTPRAAETSCDTS